MILQDLVLHLPLKSVIVFTFNSFLYYIPVIQEFIVYINFQFPATIPLSVGLGFRLNSLSLGLRKSMF